MQPSLHKACQPLAVMVGQWRGSGIGDYPGIEKFEWRYVDRTIFIGFDKWFQTVEVLGFKGTIHQDEIMMIDIYQKGLEAFYNRKWEDAIKWFKESENHETIRHKRNINPSVIYLDRAKQFLDNPPSKEWDGSFQLEEK